MGLENPDLADDGDACGGGKAVVSDSCSICLEAVTDIGDRSWAKLQCGHQFHLDCIGSAFNVKGVMQCPNCRKIEKGQWLYSNGCSRPHPEFSVDDWAHDDDLYDLSYPETTSMWCPFGGFTRLAASFEEGEYPTTAYHDFIGQHTIFTEHATAVSSATHLCPYITYVQPLHPSSSSSVSGADGPTYNHNSNQWNSSSQLGSSDFPNSYAVPNVDVRHHPAPFPPPHNRDQTAMSRRPVRNTVDNSRSGSYVHPLLLGQSLSSSVAGRAPSSLFPPHPGSAARARERAQAFQAYFQQPSGLRTPTLSGSRRSNSHQAQMGSSTDRGHGGGIYYLPASASSSGPTTVSGFQEAESSVPGPFHHTWDQGWGFHQAAAGGGGSAAIFRVRHGSPSQGQYR